MPWRSPPQSSPPLKIAIVGGGIASFVAAITLRERLPNAAITLYTAVGETMLGGQLASWNEQGYPVEHGLHALFGFYDHILPILKKVGAYANLTRSQEHIFIRERGAIHRYDLRTWPATYRGFTAAEKMRLLVAAPAIGKLVLDVRRKGASVFNAYDQYDLRALARAHGVPESVLQSGFFRQFYEAAFNAPEELSAAVALESMYKIFSKPWHYYFNSPTRESIIAPLQRHFIEECQGTIQFNHRLTRVRTNEGGTRVTGLEFERPGSSALLTVDADEYVLALGIEDFKRVEFDEPAAQHDYFGKVRRLQTVSSFSIQAWFKEDPVPLGIDSMITGMPPPFGIVCPISRVRATPPSQDLLLRHEVIATGPESGYEDSPDATVKADFLTGLQGAGFKIPDDPADLHVVLRRNREPFHRYLLTRPGELNLRPSHQSPLANLCLAGAWVRNEFALPCVDAAAQGAIKVADIIATRALAPRAGAALRPIAGLARSTRLVLPPPYRFPHSTASVFVLDANASRLAEAISPELKLFPGLGSKILFAVLRHESVHALDDASGARYGYNEVLLAAFVRERGLNRIGRMGLYPIFLYVDDDTAMAAGREIYGFPKKMARIEAGAQMLNLVRGGLAPQTAPSAVRPIDLLTAHWSANAHVGTSAVAKPFSPLPLLGDLARLMVFYNTRHVARAATRECVGLEDSQLTKVAMSDVDVRRVSSVHDLRLRVGASVNDPIHSLVKAGREGADISAKRGIQVELGFSMGAAQVVDVGRPMHDRRRVPHTAAVEGREAV
jgi:uncharacterized protein with NAD-binding domain and iron-sulfur cluster